MSTVTHDKPASKEAKPKRAAPQVASYDPSKDGVEHINIYTRGKTKLGRDLSNLQECNIEHPYLGRFRTLEGLWYYLKTGCQHEIFRVLSGHDAKKQGKDKKRVEYPLFNKMFKLGMVVKIAQNLELQRELKANTLDLVHYYVYHDNVIVPPHQEWQVEFWKILRDSLVATGDVEIIRKELTAYIDRVLASTDQAASDEAAK